MLNLPPIDELASKTDNNKYKLCCLISKRAKEVEKKMPEELEKLGKRSITFASEEVLNGEIIPSDQDNM